MLASILVLSGTLLFPSLANAVVAGGMIAIDQQWPSSSSFNKVSFFQQINDDGGNKSRYYWANQFYFKNGDGGYIGLQNRSSGVYAFNYSIWKAESWAPPTPSEQGHCRYFDHEGSGVQCDVVIPWKTGHLYQLDIIKENNKVKGVITNLMDGSKTNIATIVIPNTWGGIYASVGFVEEFSQGDNQLPSCSHIGAQTSIFRNPIGNDSVVAKQSTRTYGNCKNEYITHAACNDDQCINTVSNLQGALPPNNRP